MTQTQNKILVHSKLSISFVASVIVISLYANLHASVCISVLFLLTVPTSGVIIVKSVA